MPMLRLWAGTPEMSVPPTTPSPLSANSKPAAMRSAVVLPHPDGPSSEISSPSLDVEVEAAAARRCRRNVLRIASNSRWLIVPLPSKIVSVVVAIAAACVRVAKREQAEQRGRADEVEQRQRDAALCAARPKYSQLNTGNVFFSSVLAMVNSPSTTVAVRNDDDDDGCRMFGSSTRRNVVPQPAPRLREASTSVRTSIAWIPASIAR